MKPAAKLFRFFFKKYRYATLVFLTLLLLVYIFCLPSPLFGDPFSTVIEDRNGQLLGARIAKDGQWRFPEIEEVPEKFEKAILTFEDKRFYSHPGFDPLALGRAIRQNIRAGRIESGGSTLTMQVIRLSRKGRPRTLWQKLVELVMATRLEIRFSKKEILTLYASHAPFGGNVVGLEAASWRYFGKKTDGLSWSEAALLAVLPNSPSLIHPGRNRGRLLSKRNRLLKKLAENGSFDQTTLQLASDEPLPEKPFPLPRLAPHLLEKIHLEKNKGKKATQTKTRTTLDKELQVQINAVAERRASILKHNEIHNLAILVMDVQSGEVLAYVGNAPGTGAAHHESVDIVTAPRSTGSILKPFLFCNMVKEGQLLPGALVSDVPSYFSGYRPHNYLNTYAGAVPAHRALSRSLNIPFVKLLQKYGVERFHFDLRKLGLQTITQSPDHYGLSLILGGAEANLWDLTGTYASMARRLANFYPRNGKYNAHDFRPPVYVFSEKKETEAPVSSDGFPTADAIWLTFEAMKNVERPSSEGNWERFGSSRKVAWKTGTSIGFRDAWAIGATPEYTVGVWAGNADGEGRPGLVGVYAAAPLLFEIFDKLPPTTWFEQPFDAMKQVATCPESGYLAKDICPKDTVWTSANALESTACPFHQTVHLDESRKWRVNTACYPVDEMKNETWFVLLPAEEHYFKSKNPNYRGLPPFHPGCKNSAVADSQNPMTLVYPDNLTNIVIPRNLAGEKSKVIFQVSHRNDEARIHWHIDQSYLQTTAHFHSIETAPSVGEHVLTLVDEDGNRLEEKFRIIEK